jgi:23S rRNA (guanosine2251-2'-O)-methyltransferase
MIVYGINPVLEALDAGRVVSVRLSARGGRRVEEVEARAAEAGVPVRRVDSDVLDREARGGVHQGVVAEVAPPADLHLADVLAGVRAPLIVVLDAIEDPQNVGAILRTADAAGVHGIVRQSRHAASIGPAVAKASAGAFAHAKVVTVVNIARAIDELKEAGVWTIGLDADARVRYDEVDLTMPTAVVLGAEGTGLRRLVRERCDILAAIPMRGHVSSLNVSVAAGIVLFEAVRQRARASEVAGRTGDSSRPTPPGGTGGSG